MRALVTPLVAALALVAPACLTSAHAAPIDVIRDCSEDGTLGKRYSQKELSGALDNLPSDLDEYTDCRGVIRGAQLAGARGGPPAGHKPAKAGDDAARAARKQPTRDEATKIDKTKRSTSAVDVGGRLIRPGETGMHLGQSGFGGDLPGLLLATLVGLATATVWAAGFALQRRRRNGNGMRRGISRFRR